MAVSMRRPRRRPYGTIAVLAVLAVTLGWILVPLSQGEAIGPPLDFLNAYLPGEVQAADGSPKGGPREGMVRVFVSGRQIPAYTKLSRDDIWNPQRGTWAYTDVDESLVEEGGVLSDYGEIVGRVMARPKSPGYAFTESDFLPKGTRPGIAGGVPAGKRALRISVDKVQGIIDLQPGDRFDMVAAQPLPVSKQSMGTAFSGIFAQQMMLQNQIGAQQRARVQVLVQNGLVVSPLETRLVPTASTSLTRGTTTRTLPVQEMVIALDPEEVAPFLEALSVKARITCLARSGRPDEPEDSLTPSSDPGVPFFSALGGATSGDRPGGMSVVESIDGAVRTLVPVPHNAGEGPDTP